MNGFEGTMIGNIVKEPQFFQGDKTPVLRLRIAVDRVINRGGERVRESSFFDAKIFGDAARNAHNTVRVGMRIMAQGEFRQEQYKDKETQEPRTAYVFHVNEFGVSLRNGTFNGDFVKNERTGNGQAPQNQSRPQNSAPAQSGWDAQPAGNNGGFDNGGFGQTGGFDNGGGFGGGFGPGNGGFGGAPAGAF
jgi:single-strand DNA-binding protein